ncbi:MAG: N-6 DNA methylase, partial [Prevotella sp.]|nr:N-6 DNA methylase [Prevotella sp.]
MIDPENGMRDNFIDTNFDHTGLTQEKIKEREEKPFRDYVKKLLGRIVFLHFLQKKGWLGVPEGEEWGKGDRDFMLHLFENANDEQKDDFLDKILEPLFSEALDTDRFGDNDKFDTGVNGFHSIRIPYLNGGLFERDKLDKNQSRFPAQYFANLLTMLSQYNFTIDENDPNDAEVGVDPEMLGRIFENLLEDNKDKGAFYTPKEIVQYMCRESLIAYLQTDYEEKDKENIRQFVLTHNVDLLGELTSEIDKKLQDVKICDPAIGSGAFPMGLLRELYFCRSVIEPNIVEKSAEIKRQIIQNNIYGVDIERGAIEIARLRFWLSLIVDETSPVTLPNLDFKIMQGNSLLESYEGIDLSEIAKQEKTKQILAFDDEACNKGFIYENIKKYFDTDDHVERITLRKEIEEAVKRLIIANGISDEKKVNDLDVQNNNQFFLWHTWFNDVFSRPSKEGFDIVIGNPPYGATYDEKTKMYYMKIYLTAKNISGIQKASYDTFTLFIELGYNLLRKKGCFAYIVPISLTSSDSLSGVHRILMQNCENIHISSYAVRPKPVFENAVVNTSILLFQKTETPCQYLYSTKMYRRGQGFNLKNLIDNLQFVNVKGLTLFGRIPKIGTNIEIHILTKLFKH